MTLESIYVSPYLLPCGVSLIVSTVIHSLPSSQCELSETNKQKHPIVFLSSFNPISDFFGPWGLDARSSATNPDSASSPTDLLLPTPHALGLSLWHLLYTWTRDTLLSLFIETYSFSLGLCTCYSLQVEGSLPPLTNPPTLPTCMAFIYSLCLNLDVPCPRPS